MSRTCRPWASSNFSAVMMCIGASMASLSRLMEPRHKVKACEVFQRLRRSVKYRGRWVLPPATRGSTALSTTMWQIPMIPRAFCWRPSRQRRRKRSTPRSDVAAAMRGVKFQGIAYARPIEWDENADNKAAVIFVNVVDGQGFQGGPRHAMTPWRGGVEPLEPASPKICASAGAWPSHQPAPFRRALPPE
jgi:hypothetical protein